VSMWLAVTLVGPMCATVFAQAPAADAQEPSKLAPTDRAFARAAADDAQAEVAIAALAQQTTSSDIVRTFAEDMQRVYLEMADELREIGNRKHQPLPNVVSRDDQVTLDTLSHLTGGEFDRAFADNVVAAHREAIAAFQEAVRIDPAFNEAWQKLAILYEKKGDSKKALDAFEQTLNGNVKPDWIEVWSYIYSGNCWDMVGQRERATADGRRSHRSSSDPPALRAPCRWCRPIPARRLPSCPRGARRG